MPKIRLTLLVSSCLLALSGLLFGAATAAAQKTLGWTPPTTPFGNCLGTPFDALQTETSNRQNLYAAPGPGVITSWSTNAGEANGQEVAFKVFRPTEVTEYKVIAVDLRNLTAEVLNTFPVSIPVHRGDVIGMRDTSSLFHHVACAVRTGNENDKFAWETGDLQVGEEESFWQEEEGERLNLSATFLGVPTITALATTSGPAAGGTPVVITGTEFAEVKSVTFGTAPAEFTVDSEGQITAITPPGAAGEVAVSVTTLAGKTNTGRFTYVEPTPSGGTSTTTGPPAPTQDAAKPAPARPAVLSIAKPKPLQLKVGKPSTVKLKVTNTGGTATGQGSLRVKPPKGVSVKPERQHLPALSPGASWTVSVRVELTKQAKRKSTLPVTAAASGTTGSGSLVVKLKP